MCKGANVMRPGIKNFTELKMEILFVLLKNHNISFLQLENQLFLVQKWKSMEKGEVLKNLHFISDKFWEVGKTITN